MNRLKTPVGFIIYHRPEKTQIVFDEIKKARPSRLYVFADGPKDEEDKLKCAAVRAIIEQVDWDCEVLKNYQDANLGCRLGEFTAFDWIFKNEEQAILLEDDTVPDQTFFTFCEELLEKYKDDERIFQIAGVNFHQKNKEFKCSDSYYFSAITQTWGWASWRRAWQHYDLDMKRWPEVKSRGMLHNILHNAAEVDYWEHLMQNTYDNPSSWDAQWVLSCWLHHGLSINPRTNLITNIGFGEGAVHKAEYMRTAGETSDLINNPRVPMRFPLKHPTTFDINKQADHYTMRFVHRINKTKAKRIRWFFKSKLPLIYQILRQVYRGLYKPTLKRLRALKPRAIHRRLTKNSIFFRENELSMSSMYPRLKLDKVIQIFKPKSVLDLGCGVGKSLDYFYDQGIKVQGVEGSKLAISKAKHPGLIVNYDLNNELNLERKFDLIWSYEFVEHIHPKYVTNLLKTFSNHSDTVVLSAAKPGQGGEGHFNEQPASYWIAKFAEFGYKLNAAVTSEFKKIKEEKYSENMLVFER